MVSRAKSGWLKAELAQLCHGPDRAIIGRKWISRVRVVVSLLLMASAVGCGGSARVDGGAGGASAGDGGNGAGAAGGPIAAGAGGGSPTAGSPSGGSPSGGSPSGGSPSGGTPSGGAGGDGSCAQGVVQYQNHESWPCGCNTCYCFDGQISSTLNACITCVQGSAVYSVGDTFPSPDGCNTCTCGSSGEIACTKQACLCNPSTEWSKHYLATDTETCAVADFACPANTTLFESQCGCGCQQDPSCPEWIGCMPGPPATSCAEQMAHCPYSKLAL